MGELQTVGGVNMKLEAQQLSGFDQWIIDNNDVQDLYSMNIEFRMAGDEDVVAVFSSNETSELVINEINYNSNALVNSGDWFEIYNSTTDEYDISNYMKTMTIILFSHKELQLDRMNI